jgi:hypothetical protein
MGMKLITHLHLVRDVPLGHGSPNFLWQSATPFSVSWFAVRTLENNISDVPNHLNYCGNFVENTKFKFLAAVSVIQPGGPRVGDPCFMVCTVTI